MSFFDEAIVEYETAHRPPVVGCVHLKKLPEDVCVEVMIDDFMKPRMEERGTGDLKFDLYIFRGLVHTIAHSGRDFVITQNLSPETIELTLSTSKRYGQSSTPLLKKLEWVELYSSELRSIYIWKRKGIWVDKETQEQKEFFSPVMYGVPLKEMPGSSLIHIT